MKKILILLLLVCSFKAQSNGVWCISHDNNLYNIDKETNQLTDLYWDPIECYATQYKALENDDQVAAICKKTPKRPGCFDKNKHGQVFCEAFKEHHKKDLEGGTCTAREWDTWKNEKAYLKVDVTVDGRLRLTKEEIFLIYRKTKEKRIENIKEFKDLTKELLHRSYKSIENMCRENCKNRYATWDKIQETEKINKKNLNNITQTKTVTALCHCKPTRNQQEQHEKQLKHFEEQLRR